MITFKKFIFKGILAVSLMFGVSFCIYFVMTVIFMMTLFKPKDYPGEEKVTRNDTIFKKNPSRAVTDRKPTDKLAPAEDRKVRRRTAPDTSGARYARHKRLDRLVQATMTDPDKIIIPPSEANDWRGVTSGELTARHERLDDEMRVSMTDPDEVVIPPSEANERRGVTRGELTARHERLDDEMQVTMTDPQEIIIPPSAANDWQGVRRGELTARHERLDTEIENAMKNPPNIVFPETESTK